MEKSIQIFNHPEFGSVRVVEIDGEPFFVGRDVAIALGYSNSHDALAAHVPDKFKKDGVTIRDTIGIEQYPTLISEAGMYKLVMRSKLSNAEKFSDWVCAEVLPSIRKRGMYIDPRAEITSDLLRRMADAIDERDKAIAVRDTQIAELQPKASYCDKILTCKELVSMTVIAKDYGMSAKAFNKLLHKLGVQFKQGDIWLLYQEYAAQGWTQTKTYNHKGADGREHCRVHTYWTQKGRLELYQLLKAKGYLPMIEQEVAA